MIKTAEKVMKLHSNEISSKIFLYFVFHGPINPSYSLDAMLGNKFVVVDFSVRVHRIQRRRWIFVVGFNQQGEPFI